MVVIMIVSILAAVAIPIYRGRIDNAKWSEGRAMMGTIATQIRVWCAERAPDYAGAKPSSLADLGYNAGDFTGTYFADADFTVINVTSINPLVFTITCIPTTKPNRPSSPSSMTMIGAADGTVTWIETP